MNQPYQVMPALSADEYEALKADIAIRGVQIPVEYDDLGNILDGHHRVQICQELQITHWPRLVRHGLSHDEKRQHARRLNLDRRHLDREQRRELIAEDLREHPEASDRSVGAALGVDHKTVGAVREGLESTGEIPQLTERQGRDRRVRKIVQFVPATDEEKRGLMMSAKDVRFDADASKREHRRNLAQVLSDQSESLPTGRQFPCIYADPPWHRKQGVTGLSYENHYPTMTWDEICALPVADLLLPDAWVFMWIPRAHLLALHPVEMEFADDDGRVITRKVKLPLAWAVARAWGCENYSTCFVWTKTDEQTPDDAGMGLLVRDQDEILLMFKRGRGLPKPATAEKFTSNHRERKREHSRKPDHYREMIRSMTGGVPVLELFARVDAEHPLPPDWQAWGNEAAPIVVTDSQFPSPEKSGDASLVGAEPTAHPDFSAPVEPAAVEVGCGQAPEVNSEIAEREQPDAVAEHPALQDAARHLEPGIVEQPDTASVDAANAVPPAQRPGSNSQDEIDRDEYRALSFIKEGGQAEGFIVGELRAQGFIVGQALQKLTLLGKQRLGMLADQFASIEIKREIAPPPSAGELTLRATLTAVSVGDGDDLDAGAVRELSASGHLVLQGETLLITDSGRAWLAAAQAPALKFIAQFQQYLTDDEFVEWQALASVAAHLAVDAELVRGLIGCGYLAVILDDQLALTDSGRTWLRSIEQFVERSERINGGSIGVDLDPPPPRQIDLEDLLKPAIDLPLFLAVQS